MPPAQIRVLDFIRAFAKKDSQELIASYQWKRVNQTAAIIMVVVSMVQRISLVDVPKVSLVVGVEATLIVVLKILAKMGPLVSISPKGTYALVEQDGKGITATLKLMLAEAIRAKMVE